MLSSALSPRDRYSDIADRQLKVPELTRTFLLQPSICLSYSRPLQSIAQSPASAHPHRYFGCHCPDCILQCCALLLDGGDNRAHWHTDIYEHGLGHLKASLDCFRYRIGSPKPIKMHCMCCIACARNYQQVRRSCGAAATSPSADAGLSSVTTRAGAVSRCGRPTLGGCRDRKGVAVVV